MEYLTHLMARLAVTTNYFFQKPIDRIPPSNVQQLDDPHAIAAHKRTVMHAMNRFCYPSIIDEVVNKMTSSTLTSEAILADLMKGDLPHHPIERDSHYTRALQYSTDLFRPPQPCRPAHIFDVQHHYPLNLNVNAEAPFSTDPKYRAKMPDPTLAPKFRNMKNLIFEYSRQWHHNIKDGEHPQNYLFHMLLHLKPTTFNVDYPNKIRAIWGVPKPWIFAQMMFHWSLFAAYRRDPQRYPLLWGYETATGGHFRLNHELMSRHLRASFLMLDWSSFDKHVPHEGIDDIMDATLTFLDLSSGYIPTADYPDTYPRDPELQRTRLLRLYEYTRYAYKNTPLVLPDGTLLFRRFCVLPSGLYTTQYYDSFWNVIMITTILSELGFNPGTYYLKVLGDDSLIVLYILIPPNEHAAFLLKFAEIAKRRFNATLSFDKSKTTNSLNEVEVLSYTNVYGIPLRSNISLLARLYHTTQRRPTPEKTMATAVGIAQASFGQHRDVYYVCKDIYEHYQRLGYEPSPTEYYKQQKTDPLFRVTTVPPFPTLSELHNNLLSLEYVNKESYDKFFPRTHFLSDY
nr:RNA-dependent RNA polymerase [Sarcosphaera coronaria partitivirus]